MDSITQALLGASLGELIGGKRFGKKAALWGAVLGTIPDVDVLINPLLYTNHITAELMHRGISHSVWFSLIMAPLFGYILSASYARLRKPSKKDRAIRSYMSLFAFTTHRFIDYLTSYGTMFLAPFSREPFSAHSMFIIDPLYTIPFLVLFFLALTYTKATYKRRLFNGLALIISTIYIAWGFGAKYWIQHIHSQQLPAHTRIAHTTPESFTTFLQRTVAQDDNNRYMTWSSIFDGKKDIHRKTYPKNDHLLNPFRHDPHVQKLLARRKHEYILRPSGYGDNSVVVYPIQFGDMSGWNHDKEHFIFGFLIMKQGKRVHIAQHTFLGKAFPANMRTSLWSRIRGIS